MWGGPPWTADDALVGLRYGADDRRPPHNLGNSAEDDLNQL
jgi:hypothetical protein